MRFNPEGPLPSQLDRILNRGITFDQNLAGGFVEIETPAVAGTSLPVTHNLGHIPIGFLVIRKEGAGDIYAADVTSWTKEILYLASDATNLTARLFVM